MAEPKVLLTLVIPTFNEEKRLPSTLQTLSQWIPTSCFDVEVIIVDDGSTDATKEVVKDYSGKISNLQFIEIPHLGYMNAILTGLAKSQRPLRATLEADCPVNPKMFEHFVSTYPDFDIVMGSRVIGGDASSVAGKSLFRRVLSFVMSRLFLILFKGGIRDPQIGFKLYRADVLDHVLPLLTLRHDGLKSAELLVKALALGYRIKEVPVQYRHDEDSRCVPKGNYSVVVKAAAGLWLLWAKSYVEYKRGYLPVCPVRFGFFLLPLWRMMNFPSPSPVPAFSSSIKIATL